MKTFEINFCYKKLSFRSHELVNIHISTFIIWLNWSKVERSILIGSLRGQNLLYGPLRCTTHELNSLICVLEKKFKRKHFDVK